MDVDVIDEALLVMTLMSIFMFIAAALYRCRRVICPIDEVGVHMVAVLSTFMLIITSIVVDRPVFVAVGICIFAIIVVYYFLRYKKEEVEEYR